MIVQTFVVAVEKTGKDTTLTIADIANSLHVTASTKLRIMVNEMVLDGVLASTKQKHTGIAGFRVLYRLTYENLYSVLRNAEMGAFAVKRNVRVNSAQGIFWLEV